MSSDTCLSCWGTGYEFNGLDCPYYARFQNLPGHDPDGVCAFTCYDEPVCVTGEPLGGWPDTPQDCADCNGTGGVKVQR